MGEELLEFIVERWSVKCFGATQPKRFPGELFVESKPHRWHATTDSVAKALVG
jgi:hypothetical protein